MSIETIVGTIRFVHPEGNEVDVTLAGNEGATLYVFSVTFDSMALEISPDGEWTRKDIYTRIKSHLPIINCLGRVEIYLGTELIGTSISKEKVKRFNDYLKHH